MQYPVLCKSCGFESRSRVTSGRRLERHQASRNVGYARTMSVDRPMVLSPHQLIFPRKDFTEAETPGVGGAVP